MSARKLSAASGIAAAAGFEAWPGMGGMNLMCVPLAVTLPVCLLRMSTYQMSVVSKVGTAMLRRNGYNV